MSVPPGRPTRSLTPPQILLIGVVSVLVLLLIVLLVQRAVGGGEAEGVDASMTPSAAPTTADDAATDGATPDGAGDAGEDASATPAPTDGPPAYFAAPSGNIVCVITVDSADCVISSFSYEPEDAAECEGDGAGGHLRVEAAGASMPCDPLVVAGDVAPLAYGSSISEHGFTCDSDETGISCRHDESGYGFAVARAAYDLF